MAFDTFLKLDGIKGESVDSKHKDELEILSFSFGAENTGSRNVGGGGGAGKASFHDLHFVHRLDKASPRLLLACASGQHIKEATITVRKAGGQQLEYLKIKLTEVFVSSYQLGGSSQGGETTPLAELSLNFVKLRMDYTEQNVKGGAGSTTSMEWDLTKNKGK
jgi:type VI secretion system secreted protein Hcp